MGPKATQFMRFSCLAIGLLCLFQTSAFAASSYITPSQKGVSVIPQNTSKVPVLSFSVSATVADETISNVLVENTGQQVKFGSGIDAVYIYLDKDHNGAIDATDTELNKTSFGATSTGVKTLTFSSSVIVTSGNFESFIIAYDINANAQLDATTNIFLDTITSTSLIDVTAITNTNTPTNNEMTISGFRTVDVTRIAPIIVIPGQEEIAMLYFGFTVDGDNAQGSGTDTITITVKNENNNFSTSDGDKTGLTRAYLFRDLGSLGANGFNPETQNDPIKTLFEPDFISSSEAKFTFPGYHTNFTGFVKTVTMNFWLVYDLGDEVQVTTDTKVSAQLTSVTAKGDISKLDMNWPRSSSDLSLAAESSIAGLTHHNVIGIVPSTSTFGPETSPPMIKFTLRGNHTAITLNSITVKNNLSVGYTTNVNQTTNIVRIEMYEDTDGNGTYSGTPNDTRVSNLTLGEINAFTNINNQAEKAVLPLYYEPGTNGNSVTENGLLIPTYDSTKDYPQNNEKTFFAIYHIGKSLNIQTDASGNITTKASALLGNAVGSANITLGVVKQIVLSNVTDSTPVSGNPEAIVLINETNIKLISISAISPASVVQGQLKVPVLKFELNADTSFPSVNIQILNDKQSFLPDNSGVSKIWIYRDTNANGVLDNTDIFLQAISTIPEIDHGIVNLSGVQLISGVQQLLILYDIGQIAVLSASNINAQLKGLQGDESSTIVFGGQVPTPLAPTPIAVATKKMGIDSVASVLDTNLDPSNPFTINVIARNLSLENVSIEDIDPKVYLTDISGLDISHEFKITTFQSFPVTINAGNTIDVLFNAQHTNRQSSGTAIIDGQLLYTVNSRALVSRYKGKEAWAAAATIPSPLTLKNASEAFEWTLPSYVQGIHLFNGSTTRNFVISDAISEIDKLNITFTDSGRNVDESSLRLSLNGTPLTTAAFPGADSYFYFPLEGRIEIPELGTTDGSILLNSKDGDGNNYPEVNIRFLISETSRIERPLFFPNPFNLGSGKLYLGFNMTQQTDVDIYIFNHLGLQVHHQTLKSESSKIGYNVITFPQFNDFLRPGFYFCKLISSDLKGRVVKTTRLAVR
ncbi:MAG: hypothetical protein ACI9BD_000681 [Candidatus Marinamargulisbacteria bacterium]|jgi:hypothetical protein